MLRPLLGAALVVVALACGGTVQAGSEPEAVRLVEDALGIELDVDIVEVGSAEVLASLKREMAARAEDPYGGDAGALEREARTLVARYSWVDEKVLVQRAALDAVLKTVDDPAQAELAILVHEVAHAAAHVRYDYPRTLNALTGSSRQEAFTAVLEGHAQHVTHRACRGVCDAGYEALVDIVVGVPEGNGADAMRAKAVAARLQAPYVRGEEFIAAIEKGGGDDAVKRAFREPPPDLDVIVHPQWFLDPSTRPARADLEGALAALGAKYRQYGWAPTMAALTADQIGAGLAGQDPAAISAVVADFVQARVLEVKNPQGASGRIAVTEWKSPKAAGAYMSLVQANSMRLDAGLTQAGGGAGAEYSKMGLPVVGTYVHKRIPVGGGRLMDGYSAFMVHDALGFEVLAMPQQWTAQEMQARVADIVQFLKKGG